MDANRCEVSCSASHLGTSQLHQEAMKPCSCSAGLKHSTLPVRSQFQLPSIARELMQARCDAEASSAKLGWKADRRARVCLLPSVQTCPKPGWVKFGVLIKSYVN